MESAKIVASCVLACLMLVLGACSGTPDKAYAEIRSIEGERVGSAVINKAGEGINVQLRLAGLPEGEYGFRFHSYGKCDLPGFINAGGPFLGEAEASSLEEEAPYVGTFAVHGPGIAEAEAKTSIVTLDRGERSLFHPGGTSVVIHTLPSGEGGYSQRIACGVVVPYAAAHDDAESLPAGALESANTPDNLGEGDKNYRRPQADPVKP
jgi:Cu-Zn family superoxide dismutase